MIQKCPLLDVLLTFQLLVCQSDGSGVGPNSFVAADPNYAPFAVWGRDIALAAAAPLGRLVNSYNIQINNAAVQQQNVSLPDLTHLLEGPNGRACHGSTYRTPLFASWDDAAGSLWGLNASGLELLGEGDVGPGAYNFTYTFANGKALDNSSTVKWFNASSTAGSTTPSALTDTAYVNGRPCSWPSGAGQVHAVFVQIRVIDAINCSPWAFNYDRSFQETGLYGISSLTVQAQLSAASAVRLIQGCSVAGNILVPATATTTYALAPTGWVGNSGDLVAGVNAGVQNAQITLSYLSPSIQSILPARSISTLCNLQYFQQTVAASTQISGTFEDGRTQFVGNCIFPSVTFSNIPDLIMISIRPAPSTMQPSEADWQATFPDQAFSQFTFANLSGVFAGWPASALINMSRNNGSRSSIAQYGGTDGSGFLIANGRRTVAGGAPLLIRPGVDFPLQPGSSVGTTGQVQLNFQLKFNTPVKRDHVCTVTAISSGYFVTDNGVSRQLLVGLDEDTVLKAPMDMDRFAAQRLCGGGLHGHLGLAATHGRTMMEDLINKVKEHAAEGYKKARSAYGSGGMAGSGMTGAGFGASSYDGSAGSKRYATSLAERLMCD